MRHHIINWWLTKGNNPIQDLCLQILPGISTWHIWKSRCKNRVENIAMSYYRIIPANNQQLILITHEQFLNIPPYTSCEKFYEVMNMAKQHISSMVVKWNPPRNVFVKLKSDGCSKGNPGPAGGGGIIRNDQGKMIMAYAAPLGCMTNNMVGVMALKTGINWCRNAGITKIEIECDSKLLVD